MRRKPSCKTAAATIISKEDRAIKAAAPTAARKAAAITINGNGPRKNYGAAREKYLAQARDALAAGDRVLAENYFQHADHCYRMMVEEGYNIRPQQYTPPHMASREDRTAGRRKKESAEENTNQLPAFLTVAMKQANRPNRPNRSVQNWEE